MTSFFSIALCCAVFSSGTAFAAVPDEPLVDNEDYTVTFSQDEITDMDELIDLALEQFENQPAAYSDDTPGLIATQVLEEREYANGKKEQEISRTNILLTDDQGSPISPLVIWQQDRDGSDTRTLSNVTAVLKFNYVAEVENSINYVRPQRVSVQVTKNSSNYTLNGTYGWNYEPDAGVPGREGYKTVKNMLTGSVYSWSLSSLGRFSLANFYSGFGVIAEIEFGNNQCLQLTVNAEEYNDFWN